MKYIIVLVLMVTFSFGMKVTQKSWKSGGTFSDYLDRHSIPYSLLESISDEDQKFLTEIQRGSKYYELIDHAGHLVQALIPLNEEMQIHLFKDRHTHEYSFDIIPIVYKENSYFAHVTIESNPYSDTMHTVKQVKVAKRLSQALKGTVDTRKLRKGDALSFRYKQRTRLGQMYHMPDIEVASIKSRGKTVFVYVDEDGDGHREGAERSAYAKNGDYIHKVRIKDRSHKFGMPLRHVRVTSGFSYRRWHPILHRYRPHHGTDFGARRGTPLLAVYSGKVSYAGRMGGYGKVVKIRHPRGYESLYAHQSRIRVHRGQHVKKGQVIGYVGSTGRSTGPHLHFGLKRKGRWVNPMKVLKRESLSKKKYHKITIKDAKEKKAKLVDFMEMEKPDFHVWSEEGNFDLFCQS